MKQNIIIQFNKPLHDNYLSINQDTLKMAIKKKVMIEVRLPNGRALVEPKTWIKTGHKLPPKVYNRPDEPMICIANYVELIDDKDFTCVRCQSWNLGWHKNCQMCGLERSIKEVG